MHPPILSIDYRPNPRGSEDRVPLREIETEMPAINDRPASNDPAPLVLGGKGPPPAGCVSLSLARRVPRQRREQYFTFSQSRAHFLRHAKERPRHAQRLVGKSSLRGISLPGHCLTAPVEKAAARFSRQAIDNRQQIARRRRGRIDLKANCRERCG